MTSNDNVYIVNEQSNNMAANSTVNVRMPQILVNQSSRIAKAEGYKNLQEYIREAVRIQNLQRITAAAAGSRPRVKPMTRVEQMAAQREFFKEKGWDYDKFIREHAKNQKSSKK